MAQEVTSTDSGDRLPRFVSPAPPLSTCVPKSPPHLLREEPQQTACAFSSNFGASSRVHGIYSTPGASSPRVEFLLERVTATISLPSVSESLWGNQSLEVLPRWLDA